MHQAQSLGVTSAVSRFVMSFLRSLVISWKEGILIASSPSPFLADRTRWAQRDKAGYNEHFQRVKTEERPFRDAPLNK